MYASHAVAKASPMLWWLLRGGASATLASKKNKVATTNEHFVTESLPNAIIPTRTISIIATDMINVMMSFADNPPAIGLANRTHPICLE